MVDRALVKKAAVLLEGLSHLTLTERVLVFVGQMKAQGNQDVFAQRVYYVAPSDNASATAPSYTLQLVDSDGILLIDALEHPKAGSADCLVHSMRVNGVRYIDADVSADAWFEDLTNDDGHGLPWPIVCGARDTFVMEFTGAGLNTVGLAVHGFHVDEFTAAVFREVGELWARGMNETMAAAAIMTTTLAGWSFTFQKQQQELTHIVTKETLGASVVRSNIDLMIKQMRLIPARDARSFVVPPKSMRKPGARVSIALGNGDSLQFAARYTGNGVDTAEIQLTLLGRRRYQEC